MRTTIVAVCSLYGWLGLAATGRAQDEECRAVVAKAMKASGGEDKLAALKAAEMKAKGKVHVMGMEIEFTADLYTQEPEKQKAVLNFTIMNMNITLTQVFDGKKGWQNVMGTTTELGADDLKEHRENMNAERVNGLVALKEKHYKLSTLGEVKVGDQLAVGLQVTREGFRDVNLYFDKKTHLLIKMETRALDPNSKQEVNQEKLYSEFKDFGNGLTLPAKMVINNDGKIFLDAVITDVRPVERHDDSVFAKP